MIDINLHPRRKEKKKKRRQQHSRGRSSDEVLLLMEQPQTAVNQPETTVNEEEQELWHRRRVSKPFATASSIGCVSRSHVDYFVGHNGVS